MIAPASITFSIIESEKTWRYDLTTRFIEHFAEKIHGENFRQYIIHSKSVDDALNTCKTDYLIVQSAGHIIFDDDFFINSFTEELINENIFLGYLVLQDDYIVVDRRCIIFNIELWKENGSISFDNGRIKDGPKYAVSIPSDNEFFPKEVCVVTGASREFVPGACSQNGASIVIKQLDAFNKSKSLMGVLGEFDAHYLDDSTALSEIVADTIYEKKFLLSIKEKIQSIDTDNLDVVHNETVDIVCAPAIGLKALNLVEHYKAKRVIIFDSNPLALELQRRIFSIIKPTTYGEIIRDFLKDYPSAHILDDWSKDQYLAIKPINVYAEFKNIDLFSFESLDLFNRIDYERTMLVDFSRYFVNPYLFYRRPFYQIEGLFAEIYSVLKSRVGATFILGKTPSYIDMSSIEVNMSTVKYSIDPTIDPMEPDEDGIEKPEPPDIMFIPRISEVFNETLDEKPPIFNKIEKKNSPISADPILLAKELGYESSQTTAIIGADEKLVVLISKKELLDGIFFIFDYIIDVPNQQWSFKVGIEGNDKRIEFNNGVTFDSFKKHLLNDFKINPSTTKKFFGI